MNATSVHPYNETPNMSAPSLSHDSIACGDPRPPRLPPFAASRLRRDDGVDVELFLAAERAERVAAAIIVAEEKRRKCNNEEKGGDKGRTLGADARCEIYARRSSDAFDANLKERPVSTTGSCITADDGEGRPKPKRPLSAYNYFFRSERARLLLLAKSKKRGREQLERSAASSPSKEEKDAHVTTTTPLGIGFVDLARTVGRKWRSLDAKARMSYEERALVDKSRYHAEMKVWKRERKKNEQRRDNKQAEAEGRGGGVGGGVENYAITDFMKERLSGMLLPEVERDIAAAARKVVSGGRDPTAMTLTTTMCRGSSFINEASLFCHNGGGGVRGRDNLFQEEARHRLRRSASSAPPPILCALPPPLEGPTPDETMFLQNIALLELDDVGDCLEDCLEDCFDSSTNDKTDDAPPSLPLSDCKVRTDDTGPSSSIVGTLTAVAPPPNSSSASAPSAARPPVCCKTSAVGVPSSTAGGDEDYWLDPGVRYILERLANDTTNDDCINEE
uniref:HMG box domain-containing protein n=1 Tax=Odontella aurita TaxID=265563 RepID=A0A7S4HWE2_9STRA|mmetsp:Transcript_16138/g.46555  ORF Transcript_16138/g.46555 Transcript_16138/m.46555 type:complete len:505 (+) Transcript_16138:364-1878(+)